MPRPPSRQPSVGGYQPSEWEESSTRREIRRGTQQRYGKLQERMELDAASYQSAPPPLSTVPISRNHDYVDRPQLQQLQTHLDGDGARVALVGLGGVGKTQLATEYCYQLRQKSKDVWILWIQASSVAHFDEDVRAIADVLNICARTASLQDVYQSVYKWLLDPRHAKWLLVLDNADDTAFLMEPPARNGPSRPRLQYLPVAEHGSLLVTSRSKREAMRLASEQDLIWVEPDEEHARSLVRQGLPDAGEEDVKQMATMLDNTPLAITQALAYLKMSSPTQSTGQAIRRLRSALSTPMDTQSQQGETSNIVLSLTWHMSFDYIQRNQQTAAQLLSLMCFYDNKAIPALLLDAEPSRRPLDDLDARSGASLSPRVSPTYSAAQDGALMDLYFLQDMSFVQLNQDRTTYRMHPLVQLEMRQWLLDNGLHNLFLVESMRRLDETFPFVEFASWRECRLLFAHAKLATKNRQDIPDAAMLRVSLLYKMAKFARQQDFPDALSVSHEACDAANALYGEDNELFLNCLANLGQTYLQLRDYKTADKITMEVLRATQRVLGEDHISTYVSMTNMARVFERQGDLTGAESMLRSALAGEERVLEPNHSTTISTRVKLAENMQQQGNLKLAEAMYRQAIEDVTGMLGPEDPQTVATVEYLALLMLNDGRLDEADDLYQSMLEIRLRTLGEDHSETQWAKDQIGYIELLKRRR